LGYFYGFDIVGDTRTSTCQGKYSIFSSARPVGLLAVFFIIRCWRLKRSNRDGMQILLLQAYSVSEKFCLYAGTYSYNCVLAFLPQFEPDRLKY
jgi:hypothetical protein